MRLTQSKDSLNTSSKLAVALLAGALLSLPVYAQKGGSVATVNGTASWRSRWVPPTRSSTS